MSFFSDLSVICLDFVWRSRSQMVVNGFVPLSRVSGETEAIPLLKARAEQERSVGTLNCQLQLETSAVAASQ